MIKMIALDLDNTLLDDDKNISPANEAALKKLHKQGIKIVLCTGRPINAIWRYIEQLGLDDDDDYTITFNGGLVVRNHDKQELAKQGMSKAYFEPIYQYALANNYPLDVLDFNKVYPVADLTPSIYQSMLKAPMTFVPRTFATLRNTSYSKGIMAADKATLDQAVANMPADVADYYHIVRSQDQILEFLPKDVDKAAGLKELLNHYGWDYSNLMAFGDAENDNGMLQAAQVGVAMANAKPGTKAIANAETTSNTDDGVAKYVNKYFA